MNFLIMNNLLKLLKKKYDRWEIFLSKYRDIINNIENKYFPENKEKIKKSQNELLKQTNIKIEYMIKNWIFPFDNLSKEKRIKPLW